MIPTWPRGAAMSGSTLYSTRPISVNTTNPGVGASDAKKERGAMTTHKLNIMKPALGVSHMPDGDLLARLNAVYDGLSNNPAYPAPPVTLVDFKAAIDAYTAAVAAALDGGKASIIERHKC